MVPAPDAPVPPRLLALARGRALRPVWENEAGGVTFSVGDSPRRLFLKWAPAQSHIHLGAEAERLRWARAHIPVPEVVDGGADREGSWLVTRELAGESAVSPRWLSDPARAVSALGRGLRALHEALPVPACPYSWSAELRLRQARRWAALGLLEPAGWHPEHRALKVQEALRELADPPPVERLVVCHGDACAPNTLLSESGDPVGHVDLGSLGLGDRWADLAVASWSCEWNYGEGWGEQLLAAYGVARDPRRERYYRLLWDLGP